MIKNHKLKKKSTLTGIRRFLNGLHVLRWSSIQVLRDHYHFRDSVIKLYRSNNFFQLLPNISPYQENKTFIKIRRDKSSCTL